MAAEVTVFSVGLGERRVCHLPKILFRKHRVQNRRAAVGEDQMNPAVAALDHEGIRQIVSARHDFPANWVAFVVVGGERQ